METNEIKEQNELVKFLSENRKELKIKKLQIEFFVDESKIKNGGYLTKFTLE